MGWVASLRLKFARRNFAVQIKKEEGNSVGGRDRNFGLSIFVFATLWFESRADVSVVHN